MTPGFLHPQITTHHMERTGVGLAINQGIYNSAELTTLRFAPYFRPIEALQGAWQKIAYIPTDHMVAGSLTKAFEPAKLYKDTEGVEIYIWIYISACGWTCFLAFHIVALSYGLTKALIGLYKGTGESRECLGGKVRSMS